MGIFADLLEKEQVQSTISPPPVHPPERPETQSAQSGVFGDLSKITPAQPIIDAKIQAGETLSRADLRNLGETGKTTLKQRELATNVLRRQAQQDTSDVDAVTRAAPQAQGPLTPPQTTFTPVKGRPVKRENIGVRFGKQLYNRGVANILHTLGKSDMSPTESDAFEAQQDRIAKRKKAGHRKFVPALLDDEFEDIKRQLALNPEARGDDDLKALPQHDPTTDPFAMKVDPAQNLPEKIVDVAAGLGAFIAQITVVRKALPKGTSEPVIFETVTEASGGRPGEGAAMGAVLGTIGKIPAISAGGKVLRTGVTSLTFGGMTALAGGSTEDVIISAMVPIALQGISSGKARWTDAKTVKAWSDAIPWTKDIPRRTSMRMAKMIREAAQFQQTGDPKLREGQKRQFIKKHRNAIEKFNAAIEKVRPTGRKPVAPDMPSTPPDSTSLGFPAKFQTPVKGQVLTTVETQRIIGIRESSGIEAATEALDVVMDFPQTTTESIESNPAFDITQNQAGKFTVVQKAGGTVVGTGNTQTEAIQQAAETITAQEKRDFASALTQPPTPKAPETPSKPSKVTPTPQVAKPKIKAQAPIVAKTQAKEAKTADEAIGEQQGFTPEETQARLDKAETRFRELKNKPVADRTKTETKELAFLSRNRTDSLALMDRELRGFTRDELNARAKQFGIPFRGLKSSAVIKKVKEYAKQLLERQEVTGDFDFQKGEPITTTKGKLLKQSLKKQSKASREGFKAGALEGRRRLNAFKENVKAGKLERQQVGDVIKFFVPADKQKRFLNALAGVDSKAKAVRLQKRIDKFIKDFEFRNTRKNLKKLAKDTLSKIKEHKPMQKKGIRAEFGERLSKLIESIALAEPTSKTLHDIGSLSAYLKRVKEDIANEFSEAYAEDLVPASRLAILDKIGENYTKKSLTPKTKKNPAGTTVEEMEIIAEEIKRILHMNATKNKTILTMRVADNKELLGNISKEVTNAVSRAKKDEELRGTNQRESVLQGVTSALVGYKNDDVETLIETIGGGEQAELYEVVAEGLAEGRELEAAHGFDMMDPVIVDAHKEAGITTEWLKKNVRPIAGRASIIRKILRKLGVKMDVEPVTTQRVTIGGKSVQLTLDEIMSIHMHAKGEFNRRQMFHSPLVFSDGREIGTITGEELLAIEKLMTKKGLIVTDKASETIENVNKPGLNKVTREMDGTDNFTEADYWPMERFTEKGPRGKKDNAFSLLENRNWTKQRKGGKQPIILRGFYETYAKMSAGSAEFVGLAKPLRAIKMVLNDKTRFIDPVNKNGYEKNRKALNTLIERLEQHPGDDSWISRLFAFPLRGVTKTTLATPGIIIGQKTSTVGYLIDLPTKYAKNTKLIPTAAELAEAKKHWKWFRKRAEQGLSSAALGDVATNSALSRVITQEVPLTEKPLQGIHTVDISAIMDGWRDAKQFVRENMKHLKVGSKGYWEAVRRKAHFLVRRSQPMFDTEGRSVLTSDPHAGVRQFVLFRSYVDQVVRMVHRTNTQFANGKISKGRWTRQMGILWATLASHVITRAIVYQLVFGLPTAAVVKLLFGHAKIKDPKELAFEIGRDTVLAPVKLVTFIGYGLYHIGKLAVNNVRKRVSDDGGLRFSPPSKGQMSTIAEGVIEDMLTSAGKFGEAASLAGSGATFKSGKNEGRSKAWVALLDASGGSVYNGLRLSGWPVRPFVSWKKEWDAQLDELRSQGYID